MVSKDDSNAAAFAAFAVFADVFAESTTALLSDTTADFADFADVFLESTTV